MTGYPVHVERSGSSWALSVEGLGVVNRVRRLVDVEAAAREGIATETGDQAAAVEVHIELPQRAREKLVTAQRLRAEVLELERQAAAAWRAAAVELNATGCSMRDIGEILGVSHQRAHQLVRGD